ncbi:MAG: hypothetical protein KDA86_16475 [Planctomycetaceae bacterium]|nr:hypothetical protein [Planctomycetaceae bacterium]
MFQEPGVRTAEKIDLCHFDVGLNCLSLAEVKGIHDNRLRSRDGQVPEVIDQLRRYRVRGEQHRSEIIQACETSIGLKRRLGFKSRLEGVPESGPFSLMKKPVLVIGGCSHDDVRAILDRTPEWILLMEGLEEEAAGLILCGQNGCNLNLQAGRQCLVFDPSVF